MNVGAFIKTNNPFQNSIPALNINQGWLTDTANFVASCKFSINCFLHSSFGIGASVFLDLAFTSYFLNNCHFKFTVTIFSSPLLLTIITFAYVASLALRVSSVSSACVFTEPNVAIKTFLTLQLTFDTVAIIFSFSISYFVQKIVQIFFPYIYIINCPI